MQYQPTRPSFLPPVVKNLMILNGLMFLVQALYPEVTKYVMLYFPTSPNFEPYQIVTNIFAHASLWHLAGNMLSLWIFGAMLENVWGPKRFLTFYLATGLGATLVHTLFNAYTIYNALGTFSPEGLFTQEQVDAARLGFAPVLGASGAIFGIFAASFVLFPNALIYLYMFIPVRAKYLIGGLLLYEIYMSYLNDPGDNVAHFAHLGGALIGFILVKFWNRDKTRFY
jgi:membrane associated rhomboid family serine protease